MEVHLRRKRGDAGGTTTNKTESFSETVAEVFSVLTSGRVQESGKGGRKRSPVSENDRLQRTDERDRHPQKNVDQ